METTTRTVKKGVITDISEPWEHDDRKPFATPNQKCWKVSVQPDDGTDIKQIIYCGMVNYHKKNDRVSIAIIERGLSREVVFDE
ncbi:hypothetical protein [Pseudomonas sp. S1_E04]